MGVPVMMSTPSRSAACCGPSFTPPMNSPALNVGSWNSRAKVEKNSCVCSAKSRAGSRISAKGLRVPLDAASSTSASPDTASDPFRSPNGTYPLGTGNLKSLPWKCTAHSAFFTHTAGNNTVLMVCSLNVNASPKSRPFFVKRTRAFSQSSKHPTTSPFVNVSP